MLKKHKFNEKKLLHKIGKHWCVISIALSGLMGGFGVSQQRIHAQDVSAQQQTNSVERQSTQMHKNLLQQSINNTPSNIAQSKRNSSKNSTKDNVSTNVYYVHHGKRIGTYSSNPVVGKAGTPFHENTRYDINKDVPKGYEITGDDQYQYFPTANEDTNIAVHQVNTDKVNFYYHGKSVKTLSNTYTSDSDINDPLIERLYRQAKSQKPITFTTSDSNGTTEYTSKDWSNVINQIDKQYTNNPVSYNYRNAVVNVNITETPQFARRYGSKVTDTFNYVYGNKVIGSTTSNGGYKEHGWTYEDVKAPDSVTSNYFVTDNVDNSKRTEFTYTGGTHTIQVINKTSSVLINYKDGNNTVGTYTLSGDTGQNPYRYINLIRGNAPKGYVVTVSFRSGLMLGINVKSMDVNVTAPQNNPSDVSDASDFYHTITVNYVDKVTNQKVGNSYVNSGENDEMAMPFSLINGTMTHVPSGYHYLYMQQPQFNPVPKQETLTATVEKNPSQNSSQSQPSIVQPSSTNVDMSSYNDEINNLRDQISSYSNEMNQMRGNIQSLESDVKNVKASASHSSNSSSNIRHHKRSVKRNYRLPRTNSKYWNRVRHLNVKHGFRVYQIHALAHHRNRVLRSKWIKPNQKVSVIRYRKSNKAWVVSNHNLHHYKHYYWIYKGDTKNPNHFKFVK